MPFLPRGGLGTKGSFKDDRAPEADMASDRVGTGDGDMKCHSKIKTWRRGKRTVLQDEDSDLIL